MCLVVQASTLVPQSPVSVKLVNTVYRTLARISELAPGLLGKGGPQDGSHALCNTGEDLFLIGANLVH